MANPTSTPANQRTAGWRPSDVDQAASAGWISTRIARWENSSRTRSGSRSSPPTPTGRPPTPATRRCAGSPASTRVRDRPERHRPAHRRDPRRRRRDPRDLGARRPPARARGPEHRQRLARVRRQQARAGPRPPGLHVCDRRAGRDAVRPRPAGRARRHRARQPRGRRLRAGEPQGSDDARGRAHAGAAPQLPLVDRLPAGQALRPRIHRAPTASPAR